MLLGLAVLSVLSARATAVPIPTTEKCWCRIAPSFIAAGVLQDRVLFARAFSSVPYILDPDCPDNRVTGIRANNGPLMSCNRTGLTCPVPPLRYGVNLIEIRCEGTANKARYLLSGTQLVAIDTVAPHISLDETFPDGFILPRSTIQFSGTVVDEGVGTDVIIADVQLVDPFGKSKALREQFSTRVNSEHYWGRHPWALDVGLEGVGTRNAIVAFTAVDKLGNRSGLSDKNHPALMKRFSVGVPPAHVSISTPTNGGFIEKLAEVVGTADDPSGLKTIKVAIQSANPARVWKGNSFDEVRPIAETTIEVREKSTRWSFPLHDSVLFRQGESYVVTATAIGALGASAGARATFTFRDELLAIVADQARGEDEVLRAIDAIPRSSTATDREIDALIGATYRRGNRIGSAAAMRLSKIGRPALPKLLYRLNTGDGSNVPHIANAIGWMKPDLQRESFPVLADYLRSTNPYERRNAAIVLGELRAVSDDTREPLIEALKDPEPVVRAMAARSLRMVGVGSRWDAAMPALIDMLRVGDPYEGMWATMTLQDSGPNAAESLRPLLDSTSTQTATSAAIALARVSSGSATTAELTLPFLIHAVNGANSDYRYLALQALQGLGVRALPAQTAVLSALDDPSEGVRILATRTLVALGASSPRAREALSRALHDSRLQGAASWELGRLHGGMPDWAVSQLVSQMLREADCSRGYASFEGSAMALWSGGVSGISKLTDVLRTGNACQKRVIARILNQMGPDAASAVPALIESLATIDSSGRADVLSALNRIQPHWSPDATASVAGGEYSDVHSEVAPASIENEIIPFLLRRLREDDAEEGSHRKALEDLAYLGQKAASAIPELRRLGRGADAALVDDAIFRIQGGVPQRHAQATIGDLKDYVSHLHLMGDAAAGTTADLPLMKDLKLECRPGSGELRVAGGPGIECSIAVTSAKRYVVRMGKACWVGSLGRLEAGREVAIPAPIYTLYRGGYGGSWLTSGPSSLDSHSPHSESISLDEKFILDRPGRYRAKISASVQIAASTDPWQNQSGALVRTDPVVVEFELLPRDVSDSRRKFAEFSSAATQFQDFTHDMVDPQALGPLFDYAAIPALLHVIEKGGDSSMTASAESAFAYFCDKKRVRGAVLRDIDEHHRPHSIDEAHSLANVLAAAEAIPCRPGISESNEDYVRWDYAHMRWERELVARLRAP